MEEKKFKKWNGESMLYANDTFFKDVEEIEDYCEYQEIDKHTLKVYICNGNYLKEVNEDYWEDVFDEDGELPKEIRAKLDELNKAIVEYGKPVSWSPSKYIAEFEWNV